MLAIDRSLYQILIKLGSIFKLGPDGLYFPGTPQIYLKPFLPHTARTPQSPVIVIYGIFGAKIIIITRRSPYPGAQCQILRFHHRRSQCAYPLVGRNNLPDASIRRKLHLIHAELAVKATVGVRVVMPVVHYIIVIPFLQDTVMSRAVHRPVLIRFQNAALIFVRSQRMVRSSILHPVSMVMARARGIHEIIDSIPLQYKRSLKKVNRLRIRYEPRFRKPLQVGSHFSSSATETFIDSPRSPIQVHGTVIIYKSLSIQCNRIGHEAVGNKHRLAFTQDILPGSPGRLAHPAMNDTRLAIKIIIPAIRMPDHIRGPYPMAVGPVHGHQRPVYKILARPHLGRSESRTAAVRSGIHVIRVAKLLYRRIGKVSGNHRITRPRRVMLLAGKPRNRPQQQKSGH